MLTFATNPDGLPIVTMDVLGECNTLKDTIDKIPPTVRCYNEIVFDELCRRYKRVGISFIPNVEELTISS